MPGRPSNLTVGPENLGPTAYRSAGPHCVCRSAGPVFAPLSVSASSIPTYLLTHMPTCFLLTCLLTTYVFASYRAWSTYLLTYFFYFLQSVVDLLSYRLLYFLQGVVDLLTCLLYY